MNTTALATKQLADDRIAFLGKTYGMLALCIVSATAGTFVSMEIAFPYEHPIIMFFLLIAAIIGVQLVQHRPGVNLIALLGFGALSGMAVAPLVSMVAEQSATLVLQAYFTTAFTFAGLTAYVFISRKNFSSLHGFVWAGLITVIVLGLSNVFFFGSPVLHLAISGMSVLLFCAFILYDTSNILRECSNDEYIGAALTLYLDVFLLFENILSLFGILGDD